MKTATVPSADKYGTPIIQNLPPKAFVYYAVLGYAVGRVKPKNDRGWFSAFLDGVEIIDGFDTAAEAWAAIARYDGNEAY